MRDHDLPDPGELLSDEPPPPPSPMWAGLLAAACRGCGRRGWAGGGPSLLTMQSATIRTPPGLVMAVPAVAGDPPNDLSGWLAALGVLTGEAPPIATVVVPVLCRGCGHLEERRGWSVAG